MKLLTKSKDIISNPDSIFSYFAWPSIARIDESTLACTCSGFRLRHICPFGKACIAYSYDDGLSWTQPTPIIDTPLDDRDAGILVYGDNVILTSFNNSPNQQRIWEQNNIKKGDTSPNMKLISAYLNTYPENALSYLGSTYKISHDKGKTFGKLKIAPISSPHGPFLGIDGCVHWVGKRFGENGNNGIALYKMDENEEFKFISDIPPCVDEYGEGFSCEPDAIQLPSGKIICTIRVQRRDEHPLFTTYICYSYDGGKTFTNPKKLLEDTQGSPPHLLLHSSSTIILTYGRRKPEFGIRGMISKDDGETFSDEFILTNDAPNEDLGYPCSVERNDGSILTIWYERNEHGSNIKEIIWSL